MEIDQSIYYWVGFGLVLLLSETVIPGGVVAFLGLAAMVVGLSIRFDWIDSWVHALTLWFFSSLVLILLFRDLVQKIAGGDESRDNTDEDFELSGEIAESIEAITQEKEGRIRFRGSTWSARSTGEKIEAGKKVKILSRDNVTYMVEMVEPETEISPESTSEGED